MNFLDFIGLVGMLLLLLLASRRKKQEGPLEEDLDDDDQAQRLKDFLRDINQDVAESRLSKPASPFKKAAPVPPKLPVQKVEPRREPSPPEPEYNVIVSKKISRGSRLLHRLKSPKEMIILQEIIGPPKGLQDCGSSSIKRR